MVNAITLVAASSRVEVKATPSSIGLGAFKLQGKDVHLFLAPQVGSPLNAEGEENPKRFVAPFWFVQQAKDETKVNMKVVYEYDDAWGYSVAVPMLRNCKPVKTGDQLFRKADVPMPTEK